MKQKSCVPLAPLASQDPTANTKFLPGPFRSRKPQKIMLITGIKRWTVALTVVLAMHMGIHPTIANIAPSLRTNLASRDVCFFIGHGIASPADQKDTPIVPSQAERDGASWSRRSRENSSPALNLRSNCAVPSMLVRIIFLANQRLCKSWLSCFTAHVPGAPCLHHAYLHCARPP